MNNKGITLMALIITVVVILILAAISISVATNSNSITEKGNDAVYKNSATQIEEALNKYYVEHFQEVEDKNLEVLNPEKTPVTKSRALAYYLEEQEALGNTTNVFVNILDSSSELVNITCKRFFDDETTGEKGDEYAFVNREGKIFYLLSPESLKLFDPNLKVLDLDEPSKITSNDDFEALYGVTSDLRVFIIKDNLMILDDILCIEKEDLILYDFNTIIYKAEQNWGNIFSAIQDMTYQEVQAKKNVTIDFSSIEVTDDFDFSGIGELTHLTKLTLVNCNLDSIAKISEAAGNLTYLWIEKPQISDYSGLDKLVNLQQLYFCDITQEQLNKALSKMGGVDYSKLTYLGILGNRSKGWCDYNRNFTDHRYVSAFPKAGLPITQKITEINGLSGFSTATKNSIKYLFLTLNEIESLAPISNFDNLVSIRADSNKITSLEPLKNKTKLTIVRICNNQLTSLNGLTNVPKLDLLDVRRNVNITDINNVSNFNVKRLWFISDVSMVASYNDSDNNIPDVQVVNNKQKLISLGNGLQIDPKYSKYLVNDDTTTLSLTGTIDKATFLTYSNYTKINKLSIDNLNITSSVGGSSLSESEINQLINSFLGNANLKSVQYLQILNMGNKLTNATFLSNLNNLLELDFRNNSATNLDGLASTTIKKLSINNNGINLATSSMQSVISGLSESTSYSYWTKGSGLILCNNELYKQLKNCTSLTRLCMNIYWEGVIGKPATGIEVDLSGCTNLKEFYSIYIYAKFIMPQSLETLTYGANSANASMNLSKCKNLVSINLTGITNYYVLKGLIESVPSSNSVLDYINLNGQPNSGYESYSFFARFKEIGNLKRLVINGWETRINPINTLDGINEISSLEELTVAWCPNLTSLPDMSNMVNLKKLTINNCSLEILDGSANLSKLSKLEYVNFNNNNITNIYEFIPFESNDFKKLKTLYLKNNALENTFVMGAVQYDCYADVFNPLKAIALTTLGVEGNQIH